MNAFFSIMTLSMALQANPPVPWKADPEKMRACVEKVPERWQQTPPVQPLPTPAPTPVPTPPPATIVVPSLPFPLPPPSPAPTGLTTMLGFIVPDAPAPPDSWPRAIEGDGDLNDLLVAADKQIALCERQMKRARERGAKHEFLKTVNMGGCELTLGDWCQASAKTVKTLAVTMLAAHPATPEGKQRAYDEFLSKLPEQFDNLLLKGPATDSRGRATDPEQNVLMSGYYSPILEAARVADADFKFPIFAQPAGLTVVKIDGTGKTGWRVPDGNGGWKRPYMRSEIEGPQAKMAGKELLFLKDPLARNDLQLQGAGIVNVREKDGKIAVRSVQFAGDNGYPNFTIAKVLRCELEQRGPPYTETVLGKTRVKPGYLGGNGMRAYLRGTDGEPWAKYHELMEYTETIVFFTEGPNRGAEGRHTLILTPNVSLATDMSVVPFGFPVLLSGNKKGAASFLGFAHDTGGVIRGAHFDVYTGEGEAAFKKTHKVNRAGSARVLIPKACVPVAPILPAPPAPVVPALPAPTPTPIPPAAPTPVPRP